MADNTDDVLDNWEDEDAEVLERRMEERQKHQNREKKKKQQQMMKLEKNQAELPPTPLEVQTHLPLRTQDVGRTEYVAPIKILKRQVSPKDGSPHSTSASAVQRKSLAEREADYASARARILGTGSSPTILAAKSVSSRENAVVAESVKRQPQGPNGTKGFKSTAKS